MQIDDLIGIADIPKLKIENISQDLNYGRDLVDNDENYLFQLIGELHYPVQIAYVDELG